MTARVLDCYPPLAALVYPLLAKIHRLLDFVAPGRYRVEIHETWRSTEAQNGYLARGTSRARPDQAPHCVIRADGAPASMAVDFWIVDQRSGELAPDGALIWAVVPLAAQQVAPEQLEAGALFRTIPGGDWPHLQWKGWEKLSRVTAPGEPRVLVEA